MGSPRNIRESHTLAMKTLYLIGSALAALAVADAEPEADANADAWYGYGYGLGHRYGGYYGYGAYRPYYGRYWGRKKREAEPSAAAIPMLMQMLMLGTVPMDMAWD